MFVVCLPSGRTGIVFCGPVLGEAGVAMLRRAAEVSFFDDCPTTTLFPVGPVKVVPVGPAEAVAAVVVPAVAVVVPEFVVADVAPP